MSKINWRKLNDRYFKLLRPLQNPVSMKWVTKKEEFDNYSGLEVPKHVGPTCQVLGRCGYQERTFGITAEHFHINFCRGSNGLFERDEKWWSGESHSTGWFLGVEPSRKHHEAMICVPAEYEGIVLSSMGLGVIDDPDVICLQLSPSAAFHLLQGYMHKEYEALDFSYIGEAGCSDSWNKTFVEGKIGLSLGCRGERAFGQLNENELRLSMTAEQLIRSLDGVESLGTRGLEYPYASEALTADILVNTPEFFLEF